MKQGIEPENWTKDGMAMGGSWGGDPATTVHVSHSWTSPDGRIMKAHNRYNDSHEETFFMHKRSEEDRIAQRPWNTTKYPTEEAARKDLPLDLTADTAK